MMELSKEFKEYIDRLNNAPPPGSFMICSKEFAQELNEVIEEFKIGKT
jgi:pantoate kinase